MSAITDRLSYIAAMAPPVDAGVKQPQQSRWMWATVTQANPLRIRIDGDSAALPITPISLVGYPLYVNDLVWVQLVEKQIVVHGTRRQPMIQFGTVSVTATSGIGTATVTFPRPFPGVPTIVVSGNSGVAALVNVQYSSPTATGFTMVMQRTNTTATSCTWIATY